MKFKTTIIALVLLTGAFSGWYGYSWLPPRVNLTAEEKKNVSHLLRNMGTRCVGRYLIDMPEMFTSPSESALAFINKSPVKYKRMYRPAFEQKIRRREAELAATKTMRPLDMPYLKGIYPLPDGMDGVIFERNETDQVPDSSRILEAHIYTNGVAVQIEMAADDGRDERYSERRIKYPDLYQYTVPHKITELTELLKRTTGKKDNEIPLVPGFCLPELFIKDGNKTQKERYGFVYKAPEYPAFDFDFVSDNYSASEDSLLERSAMMERNIKQAEGFTIASGRRHLNGLYAEQWLAQGMLSDTFGEQALRFAININEKTAAPLTPMLSLSFLQQGLEGEGRLTQAEAVTIWQQITETLRIRPNAFNK